MKVLKIFRVRYLVALLVLVIGLHLITSANKTYMIGSKAYDKEQYKLFISSISIDTRDSYVSNTIITYFTDYPEWTPNIFYSAELVITLLILVFYMIKPTNEKLKARAEGVEKLQDLLLEIAIATNKPQK